MLLLLCGRTGVGPNSSVFGLSSSILGIVTSALEVSEYSVGGRVSDHDRKHVWVMFCMGPLKRFLISTDVLRASRLGFNDPKKCARTSAGIPDYTECATCKWSFR